VQNERKLLDLEFTDRITVAFATDSPALTAALERHREAIVAETLAADLAIVPLPAAASPTDLDGHPVAITVTRHT
jgi:isoleucyl-tRNA synthetase